LSSRTRSVTLVGLLVAVGFLGALLEIAPRSSAGTAVVFAEDFESGSLGAWWAASDSNAASGLDYWGVSGFRANTGNYSAWAAQIGSTPAVQQYDDNMASDLVLNVGANGYTSLNLSFSYFVRSENGGGDWLQAAYVAGGVTTIIFQEGGSSGNAWQPRTLPVPSNIERLIFRFQTDAANHNFEGAYVDDILLTGVEYASPTSSVASLPSMTNQIPYAVPYTAFDNSNASGVAYIELWYRVGGTGAYTRYSTTTNPTGQWTASPVSFDATLASGDGLYEFYTVAVDRANNTEAAPGSADASIVIDTTGPVLAFVTPTDGVDVGPSEFVAEWQGSDALTGVDRYEIAIDDGSFVAVGTATTRTFANVTDGPHTLVLRAYDGAGNMRELRVSFFVGAEPPAGFPWWILAVIVAALLGIVFFLWWRRLKDKDDEERSKAAATAAQPKEAPPVTSLPEPAAPEPTPTPPRPEPDYEEPPTPPDVATPTLSPPRTRRFDGSRLKRPAARGPSTRWFRRSGRRPERQYARGRRGSLALTDSPRGCPPLPLSSHSETRHSPGLLRPSNPQARQTRTRSPCPAEPRRGQSSRRQPPDSRSRASKRAA